MSRRLLAGYLSLALVVLIALEVPLAVTFRRGEQADLSARVERDAVAVASLAEDLLAELHRCDRPAWRGSRHATARTREGASSWSTAGSVTRRPGRTGGTRSLDAAGDRERHSRGTVASGTRYSKTLGHGLLYVAVPVSSGGKVYGAVRITYPDVGARPPRLPLLAHARSDRWDHPASDGARRRPARALGGPTAVRSRADRPPRGRGGSQRSCRRNARPARGTRARGRAQRHGARGRAARDGPARLRCGCLAPAPHPAHGSSTAAREPVTRDLGRREAPARGSDGRGRAARPHRRRAARPRTRGGTHDIPGADRARAPGERARRIVGRLRGRAERLARRASAGGGTCPWRRPSGWSRCSTIVLANALEVAPPGSVVEIEWSQGALHVLDAGPGMSDDELRHAFDRFWRAGSTRRIRAGSGDRSATGRSGRWLNRVAPSGERWDRRDRHLSARPPEPTVNLPPSPSQRGTSAIDAPRGRLPRRVRRGGSRARREGRRRGSTCGR